jgi:hypothetical protein
MNEKREFLKQYVLNRCIGNTGSMNGASVAEAAEGAWRRIEALATVEAEECHPTYVKLVAENKRLTDELHSVSAERDAAKAANDVLLELRRKSTNPALENVLAKLRAFIPFIKGDSDDVSVSMVANGCMVGIMNAGDLLRWVESEGKQ